jgi:acyl carrier protein phosphodiesterase
MMNYLAHAFLSFGDAEILTGNMISDYVKGKSQYSFPPTVQKGIRLHRAIDDFTDSHPATKTIMNLFRPQYRLYAGAFVDVVYDYFLANDKEIFKDSESLMQFTTTTYQQLEVHQQHFPQKFKMAFPYMVSQNWLYNYQFDEGMQKSFNGLVRRATYLYESEIAFEIFLNNKERIGEQYEAFFTSVKKYAHESLAKLLKS